MQTLETDVAIVGAGGAGLRAAIAVAERDPALRIALVSKVYPMRSHTVPCVTPFFRNTTPAASNISPISRMRSSLAISQILVTY